MLESDIVANIIDHRKSMPDGNKGTLVIDHGRIPAPRDIYKVQLELRIVP